MRMRQTVVDGEVEKEGEIEGEKEGQKDVEDVSLEASLVLYVTGIVDGMETLEEIWKYDFFDFYDFKK